MVSFAHCWFTLASPPNINPSYLEWSFWRVNAPCPLLSVVFATWYRPVPCHWQWRLTNTVTHLLFAVSRHETPMQLSRLKQVNTVHLQVPLVATVKCHSCKCCAISWQHRCWPIVKLSSEFKIIIRRVSLILRPVFAKHRWHNVQAALAFYAVSVPLQPAPTNATSNENEEINVNTYNTLTVKTDKHSQTWPVM